MLRLSVAGILTGLILPLGSFIGPVAAQDGIDGMHLLGRNEDEFAHMMDFHIVGDLAFASVGLGAGFQTYDISDPENPIRLHTTGQPGWRAYAHGDTVFNFLHRSGVDMFDISSLPPTLLGNYVHPGGDAFYEGGVRVGDLLYVAAHQEGIHVLEVVSPLAPQWVSSFPLANNACWNAVEHGGYLFVANGRFGLSVVDLAGLVEAASLDLSGMANDIVLSDDGQTAFLTLAADGVASVDISDPEEPSLLDIAPTLGNAFSMGRVGSILAVGSYPYAERFDVSDPQNLAPAGWDATKVYAMGADAGVLTSGDTVLVVADWRGMGVYAPEADPAGDIDVYPARLDFGAVSVQRDTLVQVRNTGAGPLDVLSIQTPSGISAAPGAFVLAPGETEDVMVTATGSGATWSTILYQSNDPDEGSLRQYVYKNNTGFPQMGSVAPDFTLQGTDGQPHTLSDYLGRVVYLEFGASW